MRCFKHIIKPAKKKNNGSQDKILIDEFLQYHFGAQWLARPMEKKKNMMKHGCINDQPSFVHPLLSISHFHLPVKHCLLTVSLRVTLQEPSIVSQKSQNSVTVQPPWQWQEEQKLCKCECWDFTKKQRSRQEKFSFAAYIYWRIPAILNINMHGIDSKGNIFPPNLSAFSCYPSAKLSISQMLYEQAKQ